MTTAIESFHHSLADAAPPNGMDLALQALWWAGKGDWDKAHGCAQQQEGNPRCDWVHAYLHRKEGDLENASHWYRSAGQPLPKLSLDEEWESVARRLLSSN